MLFVNKFYKKIEKTSGEKSKTAIVYTRGLKLIWGCGPHCKISLSRWAALFLKTTKCS